MKKSIARFGIPLLFLSLGLSRCKRDEPIALSTPGKLYYTYSRGEIYECWVAGILHYLGQLNAYDAYPQLYDRNGKMLGTCNYPLTNSLCSGIDSSRLIYRCEEHISGRPFVDIYGLSKTK